MENLKNKELGIGFIIFSIIVGVLAYDSGQTSGYREAESTFLDSAYIAYCEDDGTYCYLETNDGQKGVACNKYDNCLTQEKVEGEREKEINELIELYLTTEEADKILNEKN